MAGEGGGNSPGGEQTPPAAGAGNESPGGSDKPLESLDAPTLAKMVKELRVESGTYRTKATAAEAKIQTLEAATAETAKRLKALEDASKTEEQKATERVSALEAEAGKVSGLMPFKNFVDGLLANETKAIEGMKAGPKKLYTDILSTIPEADSIARLRAVQAIHAASAGKILPEPGDTSHPGEPGGGISEKTLPQQLGWSAAGMREAQLAGLVPATK